MSRGVLMTKAIWSLILLAVAAVAVWVYYDGMRLTQRAIEPPPARAPTASTEPQIRYPLRTDPQPEPLPALNESDTTVAGALRALLGPRALEELFNSSQLIRRVVATIDNLPRSKVAARLMPVTRAPGPFRTAGKGEDLTIAPDNSARYVKYVELARAIDAEKMVALYLRFYPLVQNAYEELGYPDAYFNDRLVEVIDHLLAAPELPQRTRLVQPKVFYELADAELEKRSAGEKILMRIGGENAAVIKAKLQEIRAELVRATRTQ
jgi:hypothetical protein